MLWNYLSSVENVVKVSYVINRYFTENNNYKNEVDQVVMIKLNSELKTKQQRRQSEGVYYTYGNSNK